MKSKILTLALLLVLFALALLFSKTDILGFKLNSYAVFGMAIGKMISVYLIAALSIFLLKYTKTKDQQRLLIAVFLILYGLLWKISYTAEARRTCVQVVEQTIAEMQYSSGEQAE